MLLEKAERIVKCMCFLLIENNSGAQKKNVNTSLTTTLTAASNISYQKEHTESVVEFN